MTNYRLLLAKNRKKILKIYDMEILLGILWEIKYTNIFEIGLHLIYYANLNYPNLSRLT